MKRKTKRFFIDAWETDYSYQTDNESDAMAKFLACPTSCVMFKDGRMYGEKDIFEEEINDIVFEEDLHSNIEHEEALQD